MIRRCLHSVIVAIILLTNCVSCSSWNLSNDDVPVVQFRDCRFYQYDEDKANQNGVKLWISGISAIDKDTIFLFGNLAIADVIDRHRSLLLRSTDGGKHWQEVEIKQEFNRSILAVAFVDKGIGWALAAWDVEGFAADGLYRSVDYGKTWSEATKFDNGLRPWGMKFNNENHGYIKFDSIGSGLNDHFGIINSDDGGITWEETFSLPLPLARDDTEEFKTAIADFSEPTGGDYGSYWNNYWETNQFQNTHFAKAHDQSEWKIYYDETAAEYTVFWRSIANSTWKVASAIPTLFPYSNGSVTRP